MDNIQMTPRLLAFQLLQKTEKTKQYSNIALDHALEINKMTPADNRLASVLFYGTIERKITLDYRISNLTSRTPKEIDPETLTAIRIGLYQLMYLDRIPPHAAINESVSLAPKRSRGFVNAVLRSHTRTPLTEPPQDDIEKYISIKYSVCTELAAKFLSEFGLQSTEDILSGFMREPETTLRVNTLRISVEELLKNIPHSGKTPDAPCGIYAKGSVRELFGFEEGDFFVQDEASQLCVEALDAKEGQLILDICSCPGSKSFGSAVKMNNRGRILAFDLHENKLPLVRNGAKRLGIEIIETTAADGRNFIPDLEGTADRVLCDVPCSGFGIISKKPELRYKDPAESAGLPEIQSKILDNSCKYVKQGGILVYSTCTLLPDENENNILSFLKRHPEFKLCPFKVGNIDAADGLITLFPHIHKTDGFFIAKLIRK